MPRPYGSWKKTTFDLYKISIKNYQKLWVFKDWYFWDFKYDTWASYSAFFSFEDEQQDESYIKLRYYFKWKYREHKIIIEKVKCNFWGFRYYFICPKLNIKVTSLYLWRDWYYLSRKAQNLCYETQLYWKRQRAFNKLFSWDDAEKIEETIKYPFRNWKPTRKYLKAMKIRWIRPTKMEFESLNKIWK